MPRRPNHPTAPRGLYDPSREHDACGVGLVCHIKGEKSHQIIADALKILRNLSHRGACSCDETTGDGAGIQIQLPDAFLRRVAAEGGVNLPPAGDYACGLVFLPQDPAAGRRCRKWIEQSVAGEGQRLLGWRRVPVGSAALGNLARAREPAVYQVFVGKGENPGDPGLFERKLFVIRRVVENGAGRLKLAASDCFHVVSLSSRTLIYKGLLLAEQIGPYYPDLSASDMVSALALVHQRYSTNTFPTWDLAQPFRFLCHNGEINTLQGNRNWLLARQHLFQSKLFGPDIAKLLPVVTPAASDSATLDNAVELLYHTGRSLPHAVMMLIPEAWEKHAAMSRARRDFYAYHSCLMEPWDGPAAVCFTDGTRVGAVLDRNGLRPARYTVTTDDRVVMASETGVLPIPPHQVRRHGRLEPGCMFLVDLERQEIVGDDEIKETTAARRPYGQWLANHLVDLANLPAGKRRRPPERLPLLTRQRLFGYTAEDLKMILLPMARDAAEPLGSMGDDIPPAVLSTRPRLLFDYFCQLFAQVTNPPLDAIREELVTSLALNIGPEQNLFTETPQHCRRVRLPAPILTDAKLARLRGATLPGLTAATLNLRYPASESGQALAAAVQRICRDARRAVRKGKAFLILSDRGIRENELAIPSLLAVSAVHHDLIRRGLRPRCDLIVESGEVREVHHFCCLIGYGAGAVNPYLAMESIARLAADGQLPGQDAPSAVARYVQAAAKGILKVISKMGISTLQSYRGAQIFECIGLSEALAAAYFPGTASRIGGAGLDIVAREAFCRRQTAFPPIRPATEGVLDPGGRYKWRRGGEVHQYTPHMIGRLQQAVRLQDEGAWRIYTELVNEQNRREGLLCGLLDFRTDRAPVPLEEVEPWTRIVRRFKTGAMSYGSISREAHETIAIAMNRIGGKSNSGEGGEDTDRFTPDADGSWRNSAIKQVASGRFGVTAHYLAHATDLQIKMAQGAKPGEGGQLPAHKVYPWIARTRHATPHVGLISPPPHHDIYSIEDLSQLIHDLKNANPAARINVKLVSEVGVGTIAAGVAKAKADLVLISGHSGGTGAAPLTAIRHSGLPWELGLAETHQTLVRNGLRSRIVVECDGQLKTARDVAIACLLGAEEFGFGSLTLVSLGCVMMRVCHLNTCPVGIATQDPDLRSRFTGRPEHLVNLMTFIAHDLRRIMARLGFRSVREMVGRVDCLRYRPLKNHWKARELNLSKILYRAEPPPDLSVECFQESQDHGLDTALDHDLIARCRPALEKQSPVKVALDVRNVNRTVGTMLSYHIARRYGEAGLPEGTITIQARGTAGQSFFAFGAAGLSVHLAGEANDYFAKGLSGACVSIAPPAGAAYPAGENIIVGNVALYGATSGRAYVCGRAGERFCVRNSGATAVVEGVGDHGCEYMTGGTVAVLGPTGRNFAAGMSGGVAYVYDAAGDFGRLRCNRETVLLEAVAEPEEKVRLRELLETHRAATGSAVAQRLLDNWEKTLPRFVRVMPLEYKRALAQMAREGAAD